MAKKSVSWKDYLIDIDEKGSVKVSKQGTICDNAKAALREIAEAAGFEIDEKWNTQQFGAKLAKFLEDSGPAPVAKPKAEAPKTENKDDEPQVKASKADIAGARVRVYGKAQNRTALGIMHAYMVMYPQTKLDEIRKAFPDELNPDSGVKKNFVYAEDKGTTADWNGFFKEPDELLKMGDGKKVFRASCGVGQAVRYRGGRFREGSRRRPEGRLPTGVPQRLRSSETQERHRLVGMGTDCHPYRASVPASFR